MRFRSALAVALAAGVLAAPYAGAAAKPQIEDPAGDQLSTGDYDLVSVLFETVKDGDKLKNLVITMTTSAPPSTGGLTSYNMRGDISGCGTFLMYTYTSAIAGGTDNVFNISGCGPDTDAVGLPSAVITPKLEVKGNSLVYTMPFSELPSELKKATFSGMEAWTAPAEPVLGFTLADFDSSLAFDAATATSSFKVGG